MTTSARTLRLLGIVALAVAVWIAWQDMSFLGYSSREEPIPEDWRAAPFVGGVQWAHSPSAPEVIVHGGSLGPLWASAWEFPCTSGGSACGPNTRVYEHLRVGDLGIAGPLQPIGACNDTAFPVRCDPDEVRLRHDPRTGLYIVTIGDRWYPGSQGYERPLGAFSRHYGRVLVPRSTSDRVHRAAEIAAWLALLAGALLARPGRAGGDTAPVPAGPYRSSDLPVGEDRPKQNGWLVSALVLLSLVASGVAHHRL